MIKTIGYAYPSSITAERLGAGETGCYFVETRRCETQVKPTSLYGPFATMGAADSHALAIDCEWSRYTKRATIAQGWTWPIPRSFRT